MNVQPYIRIHELLRSGQREEALNVAQDWAAATYGAMAYSAIAHVQLVLSNRQAALTALHCALDVEPTELALLFLRARVHHMVGDFHGCLSDCQACLLHAAKQKTDYYADSVRVLAASCYLEMGRPKQALAALQRARQDCLVMAGTVLQAAALRERALGQTERS